MISTRNPLRLRCRSVALYVALGACVLRPAAAADATPTVAELKAKIEAIRAGVKAAQERIDALQKSVGAPKAETPGANAAAAPKEEAKKPEEPKPAAPAPAVAPPPAAAPAANDVFDKEIRPIFEASCNGCHVAKSKGGLSLANRAALLKGGDQGPAVNLEKPTESLLLAMISYKDGEHQMPPKGKLPAEQIAAITKWVEAGAPWPDVAAAPGAPAAAATDAPAAAAAPNLAAEQQAKMKAHWAYQPVAHPAVPQAADAAWNANPIDAFIAAGIKEKGIAPAPPASRRALIRRATYDLIGLPPSPEEVEKFAADDRPEAYPELIERLLASPQYGERWGRRWLDVARYAETNGYERDGVKPFIWRYRDYVIDAFNKDKPYDVFVKEQLAGDELPGGGRDQIIATGYLRLAVWDDEPADKPQGKYDTLDDIVNATAQGMLGITMGCARCHAHKIDFFPHADYYKFLSFFHNLTDMQTTDITRGILPAEQQFERDIAEVYRKQVLAGFNRDIQAIEDEIKQNWRDENARKEAPAPEPGKDDWPVIMRDRGKDLIGLPRATELAKLRKSLDAMAKTPLPGEVAAAAFERDAPPPDTFIFTRGNPNVPAEKVEPGFPSMLPDTGAPTVIPPPPGVKSSGRRRALAEWIASPANPLTARVMVNRIWQGHFGRGIVRTPNDFGLGGTAPTHPALLDWLAGEFTARGWSVKSMHRLMMNSMAYKMSSLTDAASLAKDPANDAFGRFNMRRLEAEEVRDSILSVAGALNPAMGGPSVYPELPPEVLATSSQPEHAWGKSSKEDQNRRSIYAYVKRSLQMPILADFDQADTDSSCPARFSSILPGQALNLLNSAFIGGEAAEMARRLEREAGEDEKSRVRRGLELVMQREPKPEEIEQGLKFIGEMVGEEKQSREKALERFCLLALNLNEFMFVD